MTIDYVLREQFDALKKDVETIRAEVEALRRATTPTAIDGSPVPPPAPLRGQIEAEQAIREMKGQR